MLHCAILGPWSDLGILIEQTAGAFPPGWRRQDADPDHNRHNEYRRGVAGSCERPLRVEVDERSSACRRRFGDAQSEGAHAYRGRPRHRGASVRTRG
jgi:hypothetical protein